MSEPVSTPSLTSRPFGRLPGGETVAAWTLRGAGGLEVEVITYGGIITRLLAPDRHGNCKDLVLGFDQLDAYLREHPYFGAIVGRVAGRIAGGRFLLQGKSHELDRNDPPNHLHGGPDSIDRKLWKATPLETSDQSPSLQLSCESPDGENGYPGKAEFTVTYTLSASNELQVETLTTVDQVTPISLTQHSYFNLAGEGSGTIFDHELLVRSGETFAVDESMTLLDRLEAVEGRATDLRRARRLGDVIPSWWKEHGDLYWLGESPRLRPVAELFDPGSGRRLTVATTSSCLQCYTGVSLDGTLVGKSGRTYEAFSGFCLECEGYPQAITDSRFGSILVYPGEPQRHLTVYRFSTDSTLSGQ